jgi:hypothetical protein
MARKKMWWQDPNPLVKPWIINLHRDPCNCNQGFHLRLTGMSKKQGPTHYCPGCRWAFWPVEMKPSYAQVRLAQKTRHDASGENMKYIKMRNKPSADGSQTLRYKMIDQLGPSPLFLTDDLKKYWRKKYCDKYPNSDIAKRQAKKEKEDWYK